jgi:hypothetical protein
MDRKAPIELARLDVVQRDVRQGDKIDLSYDYFVKRDCRAPVMTIAMYDQSERIRLYETPLDESVDTPSDQGPEVYTGITKRVGVPVQSDIGPARLETEIKFICSMLHHLWPVRMKLNTINFTILPAPLPAELETLPVPPVVQELKQEIEVLKDKVEKVVPSPEPSPEPAPHQPESIPMPIPTPMKSDREDDSSYKPKPEDLRTATTPPVTKPKTVPKKPKPTRPPVDDDPDEQETAQQSASGVIEPPRKKPAPPKEKAKVDDGDTPEWFRELIGK